MERVNQILNNGDFQKCMEKNRLYEENRRFCCHNMEHLLDVARIAWILNLERGLDIQKDIIYAAALLHDIGRWTQYETGEKHAAAGTQLAAPILTDCRFQSDEMEEILDAIASHSGGVCPSKRDLAVLLWEGDKKSRRCWQCKASYECDWQEERKNMRLEY